MASAKYFLNLKCVAVISVPILLVGCDSSLCLSFDNGEICIPPEYEVSDVWWLPSEYSEGKVEGVAFKGCWRKSADVDECLFPSSVVGGEVMGGERFHGWKWEDFSEAAWYRRLFSADGAKVDVIDEEGQKVVVYAEEDGSERFAWLRQGRIYSNGDKSIGAGDELISVCRERVEDQFSDSERYLCMRIINLSDYSVQYTFISSEVFPEGYTYLDESVANVLRSWEK